MRPMGFSTGALAKSDVRRGVDLQIERPGLNAIELSALRDHELRPLVEALPKLNLERFSFVSVHAPSRLRELREDDVIELLLELPPSWPIITHSEIVITPARWERFGDRLCLENMDNRKAYGRTATEMRKLFSALPGAMFCLDIGHAHQIDPTMAVAFMMLDEFADRLVELHISEIGSRGEHLPIHGVAAAAFRRIAHRIPPETALIIESVVPPSQIDAELAVVRSLFDERDRAVA